jgi:copper/silver efflux system protein
VTAGPDLRRGVADLNGSGDVVSGIIVMRQGRNAMDVIRRVRARIREIEPGLPAGMKIVPVYDRSELVQRSIDNLRTTILEVIVTVALVIFLFLRHPPSALIPAVTIPVAVLISFVPFRLLGLTANIMSLGGIAIAIGALVDAAIVVVEQTHKKLEEWERMGRPRPYRDVVIEALKEVGGPSFFSLLVIGVSFLPVLALEAQEGRLFHPLAYTKTLAMVVAAFLAITLDPALRITFTHVREFHWRPVWLRRAAQAIFAGRIHAEDRHPISRTLIRVYEPAALWALRHKPIVAIGALGLVLLTIPAYLRLGSEFMPPLDEGALFYMPTTMPGISIGEAQSLLQITDRVLKQFPEVDQVLGKAGRAETATDPAPLSMLETVITLKPVEQWRGVPVWYSAWAPEWLKGALRHITPDHISREVLVAEMNEALRIPGLTNAWTMPVKGRIDMLTTGMRTPVGLKSQGDDLSSIGKIGAGVERALARVRGTRSIFAERTADGYFLDFEWKREQLARYGITLEQAQQVIQSAIGGETVTTTVEGRARYPVNVRYKRDYRSDRTALERVLVPAGEGRRQIPLVELANIRTSSGPAMIRDEDGLLTGYVYIDVSGRDIESYIQDARKVLDRQVPLPPGYALHWSGQYESMERVRERLKIIVPATLLLILMLLYLNTRSVVKTLIVALAVPFSAVGAVWFLYLMGYNLSVAVWIGMVALAGVDAETGVFMLLYLDLAYDRARRESRLWDLDDLRSAVIAGAVKRIRPKFMTVSAMFVGLVPIMWASGTGADVMKRIAAPMIGGIFTSFLLELLVYPVIYETWKWRFELKRSASRTLEAVRL